MTTFTAGSGGARSDAEAEEASLASQMAAGLRHLADTVEENPDLAPCLEHTLLRAGITAHLRKDDRAAQLGHIARVAMRAGAKVTKDIDETWHNLHVHFGAVRVAVLAYREEVCERVVVDTREVVEEVPDPEALAAVPTVTVTRTEEIVEWRCRSLLDESAESTSDGDRS